MYFGVIITLSLQYSVTLEVETKHNYTYLKGILTFISSAYLPRTSQGACNFTKMMSLFVRDDCKRKTKQPPGLTFSNEKDRNCGWWSISLFLVLCHPSLFLILPQAHVVLSVFCQLIFLLVSWKPCCDSLLACTGISFSWKGGHGGEADVRLWITQVWGGNKVVG